MRRPGIWPRERPLPLRRPEQGWASLVALLGMLGVVGLAISDTWALPLGGEDRTGWLVVLMLVGGLVGYVLAHSSIGLARAHVIGAAAAAGMLLLMAAAALGGFPSPIPGDLADLEARIALVLSEVTGFVGARSEAGDPATTRFLVLGAICWTTAQFSAFSVFRHGRGGPAVMATGIALFLDLSLAAQSSIATWSVVPVLAVYTSLAMLLLVRLQLTQQGHQWARRHIADTGEVGRLFLRSGVIFVALVVTAATSLTVVGTAPAQDHHLSGLRDPLADFGEDLSSWLPFTLPLEPDQVPPGGEDFTIGERWTPGDGLAFTASVPGGLLDNYWWGWALDRFDGRQWDRRASETRDVAAGERLATPPEASGGGDDDRTARIDVVGLFPRAFAFGPAQTVVLDVATSAVVADDGGSLAELRFARTLSRGASYNVDARVRDYSPTDSPLTADDLRAAGTRYPDWVRERYLQGRGTEAGGPRTRELAEQIMAVADNPYDQAISLQRHLHAMEYREDITGLCGSLSWPECILTFEQGFCSQYASTMAMVLRQMGIPSRFITGYLPGTQLEDGTWEVEQAAFHNWVEAWFPGAGWVRFDPTPGRAVFGQALTDFPEEENDPSNDPQPLDEGPGETEPPLPEPSPSLIPATQDATAGGPPGDPLGMALLATPLALVGLLLLAALLLLRLRRLPEADPGLAFRGIVNLATRFGYGPHPSQTELEYAATLSETLPDFREDLYLVAGARVESVYGRRGVSPDGQDALRRAYARIQTALVRLRLRLRR